MELKKTEQQLIDLIRKIQFGDVTITVHNGYAVNILEYHKKVNIQHNVDKNE